VSGLFPSTCIMLGPISRALGSIYVSRYPYIATEVLCSEIWSIVETCVNEQKQLLVPFWETVLDRSPDDMKTQMTMASHFAKVNSVFMTKKPAEVSRSPRKTAILIADRVDACLHSISTQHRRATAAAYRNTLIRRPSGTNHPTGRNYSEQ